MKNNSKLLAGVALALVTSLGAQAQNTSYNANTVGIGGSNNVALGVNALVSLAASGQENVGLGFAALKSTNQGYDNTATGFVSMLSNTGGHDNAAFGARTLQNMNGGKYNCAFGSMAGMNTQQTANTAIGFQSMNTDANGNNNTTVGFGADVGSSALNNASAFGSQAVVTANDMVVIGNTATGMVIGGYANWTNLSDGRFKNNIQENVPGLTFINKLRPVTYVVDTKKLDDHLTQNMSPEAKALHTQGKDYSVTKIQTGFIAQEVEAAAKDLNYDFDGVKAPKNNNDHYGLAYSQFVVPLVKGMQEQQTQIETQAQTIKNQQQQIDELKAMVNALAGNNTNAAKGALTPVQLSDKNVIVLNQNVPNPFAESTTISYNIPNDFTRAQIIFTSGEGVVIKAVTITEKTGTLNVFGSDLTHGVYSYALVVDGKTLDTKKMIKE